MLLINILSMTVILYFFKNLTTSDQKRQICERTLIFCQFLRGPNEFASFCLGFSSGKLQVLEKLPKS